MMRPYEKIGLHIIDGWAGDLGLPRVVTLVNPSPTYVHEVRSQVGKAWIVVRWVLSSEDPRDGGRSPVENADRWLARFQGRILEMLPAGPRLVFQALNEPVTNDYWALVEYEARRMTALHSMGARAALYSFSVGNPIEEAWVILKDVFSGMREGDVVGLHEYWSDRADIVNPEHWFCGRFTQVPELEGRPIIVSECGRDAVGGNGAQGWKKGGISVDTYLGELQAYSDLLMESQNVIGATAFTVGNDPRWRNYDMTEPYGWIVSAWAGTGPDWSKPEIPEPPEPPEKPSIREIIAELDEIRREMDAEEKRHAAAMGLIQVNLDRVTDELERWYGG